MANGTSAASTHTAMLPHTNLPNPIRTGHILPSLTTPLLSISKFCDAGYRAVFDADRVVIQDLQSDSPVLSGHRSPNGLWQIPIPTTDTTLLPSPPRVSVSSHTPAGSALSNSPTTSVANFTVHDATVRQAIQYLHLCLFSPTKSTFLAAIRNNHFVGWPSLTANAVQRHLHMSVPTLLGHMDQQRQNVRSTTRTRSGPQPPSVPGANDNRYAALADVLDDAALSDTSEDAHTRTHIAFLSIQDVPSGMVYSDQTGTFPVTSSRGIRAVMVLYDYDSNAILIKGIASRGQSELLRAYTKLHQRLVVAGLKPRMQRLDNEASAVFKKFLAAQHIDYQLTPASMHRRNAAERAIRTWKNISVSVRMDTDGEETSTRQCVHDDVVS